MNYNYSYTIMYRDLEGIRMRYTSIIGIKIKVIDFE